MRSLGSIANKRSILVPKIPTVNSEFCKSLMQCPNRCMSILLALQCHGIKGVTGVRMHYWFTCGVRFCDKNVGRNNAGLEKTGFKDTPIFRPKPNETPTQNMFLKSSHRALSNGAIHITIQGDPDPNMYRSKSILI